MPTPDMPRGVRSLIVFVCEVVRVFRVYRQHVEDTLPPEVYAALLVLDGACEALKAMNPPGPH